MSVVLWIFFLSNSKRTTKELVYAIDGFQSNKINKQKTIRFV